MFAVCSPRSCSADRRPPCVDRGASQRVTTRRGPPQRLRPSRPGLGLAEQRLLRRDTRSRHGAAKRQRDAAEPRAPGARAMSHRPDRSRFERTARAEATGRRSWRAPAQRRCTLKPVETPASACPCPRFAAQRIGGHPRGPAPPKHRTPETLRRQTATSHGNTTLGRVGCSALLGGPRALGATRS
jgi:hypothetical protein